ncbi:MAG: DUF2958 domain-containing protein [Pseudomonadota bacterium]
MHIYKRVYETCHRHLMNWSEFEGLIRQGVARREDDATDSEGSVAFTQRPLVKLFTPDAQATWLLSELDPEEPELAFGLCDLGLGFLELGDVSIIELVKLRGPLGLPVEQDQHFTAKLSLWDYAQQARQHQRTVA